MATNFANLGGVADPRSGDQPDYVGTTHDTPRHNAQNQRRHSFMYSDSSITFEEYNWWAERSREYEKELSTEGAGIQGVLNMLIGKKTKKEAEGIQGVPPGASVSGGLVQPRPEAEKIREAGGKADDHSDRVVPTEKDTDSDKASPQPNVDRYGITEDEWYHAQRAVRTATWGSVFYLITTDILGPFSVPWAISQMGYGPGAGLYIGFGILAAYSGSQLWRMFCGLDSTKFPLRNYGDLAFRVYGNWARLLANTLQSFQFFMNVTILIVSNGQGLGQMVAGRSGTGCICFVVAELVFMLCGFVLGQIRTLQRLGMLANLAVWLNIITIIMTMVVTNVYPPNYAASLASYNTPKGPITTYAYWPPTTKLNDHINGLMQGVYSYGGATLFNELMAEMRRPHDFWKGLICAEFFIVSVYLIMGMVVYNAQGQFAFNPAYQGIPNSAYSWQTLGNALSYITGVIAALLYGNIGIKVFYASVFRDLLHFPPLDKKIGKWIWVGLVPVYWGLAFVVAAAIPQISYLSAFVGAACILQFSYTFPPILMVGYNCQKDAMRSDEGFDPTSGQIIRHDTGFRRWMRGFMKKWYMNIFDSIYFVGALAVAGLGIYASVISMHQSFSSGTITAFTCKNPAGGGCSS
ncbi:oligopeptide transporter protein [Hortaea werneckii]|nr:oligopeptide transporter protein [Hortaea werneckii]KAI7106798.1 oligopeptide transporter protein [Hortaea werneckii]KAI7222767.1 oligopeptide transporter protein [Hortaea werneckii]KAI7333104.1 oligopeptide transporter protein [Hortaea werneckii]KAI7394028.1 oligopeptide transporter protein [Hortaea werneckii]